MDMDGRSARVHADRAADVVEHGARRVNVGVGHGTQAVEAGYMANAWVRLRHPDFDTARAMLDDVGRTIHVHAG